MRSLALSLVVLLCVSAAQALTYDFNALTSGSYLNGQSAGGLSWVAVGNANNYTVEVESGSDLMVQCTTNQQERIISTLTDPNDNYFDLDPNDSVILLTATVRMNIKARGYIGIWVDGTDGNDPDNTMANSDTETLCQFGIGYKDAWRVRGAAGGGSVYDYDSVPAAGSCPEMKFYILLDLDANSGNGSISAYAEQLSCGNWLTAMEDIPLGLSGKHPYYADPSKWTGWMIRSQAGGVDPNTAPGGQTIDDLTVTVNGVVPEPATLSLLVLGGLACLRRRR